VAARYTRYLLDDVAPDWDEFPEYNKDDILALKAMGDELQKLI
jgi:hypothetical protein